MSKPDLKIDIEPFESGKVQYLPLGATSANGVAGAEIVLRLNLQNVGTTATTATGITFSFPGSSQPSFVMQKVDVYGPLTLGLNQSQIWSNGIVSDTINNSVYLTGAAPSQIKIDVVCTGFSIPASVTYPLAPHESPVSGGAYRFPFAAGDLRSNEYLQASAVHPTGNGGRGGTQICAHDVVAAGWDESVKGWTGLVPGGDSKKNEGYRMWNRPICAMADGTIVDWLNTMGDNTVLGKMPVPTPNPVFGNNILVKHGTEVVRYCHFRKGSITPALMQKGAVVLEGQRMGNAGNSGNSSGPHTHIEVERASDFALRPFPFRDAWVIDQKLLSPSTSVAPWYKLHKQGIPKEWVSVWPASTYPGYPVPVVGFSISGNWGNNFVVSPDSASFSKTVQDLFDTKGRRLICATTFLENGHRRWAGISRDGDWASRWWVSPDLPSFEKTAQDYFDGQGLRLIYANTYVEGGKRYWIGISRGGDWANRLFVHDDLTAFSTEAQSLFDKDGLRLIHVTTWLEGSKRMWLGIAQGGTWANTWWISPNLSQFGTKVQDLFDNQGKRLTYVTTYKEGNERRWIGIARSATWAHRWYFKSDLDSFSLEAQQLFDHNQLRLCQVEFLE